MSSLWDGMLGVGALAGLILFVVAVRRWPVVGAVVLAINVLLAWEFPNATALAVVEGRSIYFLDVLGLALLLVGLAGVKQLFRNLGSVAWLWLAFGLVLLVSLARGLTQLDPGVAVTEFRSFFYNFATITWAMTLAWNPARTRVLVEKFALALGWGLVVVGGYHLARYGLGSASAFVDASTGLNQTSRPLVSGQALILLICAVVSLWLWGRDRRKSVLLSSIVFLAVVVVVQQRTVWGVAIAVAAVIFVVSKSNTKSAMVVFGIVAAWGVGLVLATGAAGDLLAQLEDSATNFATYDARLTSWADLIDRSISHGFEHVAFGAPFGSGYGRFEGAGRWVEFAPHNWYLTVYLRAGLLGFALFALFLILVLVRALRTRGNSAAIAILVACLVYGWSYSWLWYTGGLLGWAISRSTGRGELPPRSRPTRPADLVRPPQGLPHRYEPPGSVHEGVR
ncbi:O-antigen ligase family protein [Cryobacterium tagatosivorans]|uniref:O-antigen ligase domain-containing protein n=1 Tax=Cryobacterium tagatosivorans TaxID=1259199 RepID=A0A4R8UBD9_9MICO|nr:hypothetical protein [Cryobacterium tagatosivorans]TFB47788.1 hypothetical protein E3O23_14360 [Cryobacterium tagatosivorans]